MLSWYCRLCQFWLRTKVFERTCMNSRTLILSALALATLVLTGCGPYPKEVGDSPDPGRVIKVENTELKKIQLGNTAIYYIGDKETQSCVAQTERVGPWWGSPSVSIAHMPPEACGFPPKVVKTEVINMPPPPPQKAPPTPAASVPKKAEPPAPTPCPVCKTTPWQVEGQPSGASAMLALFWDKKKEFYKILTFYGSGFLLFIIIWKSYTTGLGIESIHSTLAMANITWMAIRFFTSSLDLRSHISLLRNAEFAVFSGLEVESYQDLYLLIRRRNSCLALWESFIL